MNDAATAGFSSLPSTRRFELIVAAALAASIVLAVGLRSWRLSERGLWFDEAFSWRLSTFGWMEIVHRTALDNNPPLYYLLLKFWTACFGTSLAALRSLSVAAGAGACLAMYGLVREAYGGGARRLPPDRLPATALVAAALVATSVLQIRWSWEARMYSLGALLAALSSWLLLRALHGGHAPWRWLAYAASALAFAYTHTFALFSLLAQGVYAVGYLTLAGSGKTANGEAVSVQGTKRWIGPFLAAAVIVAGYAPWLNVLAAQHEQVRQSFWIAPLTRESVPKVAYALFVDPTETASGGKEGWVWAGLCAVVLAALAIRPVAGDTLVALSAVVPLAGAAIVSAWDTPIFYPRYFVFAQLFLLAAAARLVGRLPGRPERWIAGISLVAAFLSIDYDYAERLAIQRSGGLRSAAKLISDERSPGEPVVVCSPYFYLPLRYELGDACRLLAPNGPLPHFDGAAVLMPRELISCTELADCRAGRLWVVEGGGHSAICALPPERWQRRSARSFYETYAITGSAVVIEYRERP